MRLRRHQSPKDPRGFLPAARRPAERGAIGGLALAEQQVVRFALDQLACGEPKGCGAWPRYRLGGSPPFSDAWM